MMKVSVVILNWNGCDMHIRMLRQKLGESGAMIKTVRNVGYRMSVRP